MPDIHVTRELLQAWERSELELPRLLSIGIDHLTQCCPHCAREFSAWARNRGGGEAPLRTLQSLSALLEKQGEQLEREARQAGKELKLLLRLPAEGRVGRVRRARKRFATYSLASLLLETGKRYLPGLAVETLQMAQLAEEVLRRSSTSGPSYAALYVQIVAHQGNALRAQGELREAERYFDRARRLIREEGVTDLAVCAEVDSLEGSLRKDLRQLPEAISALSQSVMLYRITGQTVEAARSMMILSTAQYQSGDVSRAIQTVQLALLDLHPETQSKLYFQARYNLALYLCEMADYRQARALLSTGCEVNAEPKDAWTRLRLCWLEGRVALGLGEAELAEAVLSKAHQGFAALGNGYDAALVALDLSSLYLSQHRHGELKLLAREVVSRMEALGVHREALMALSLFREAAVKEELSRSFLRELTAYLERARKNPQIRFQAPA